MNREKRFKIRKPISSCKTRQRAQEWKRQWQKRVRKSLVEEEEEEEPIVKKVKDEPTEEKEVKKPSTEPIRNKKKQRNTPEEQTRPRRHTDIIGNPKAFELIRAFFHNFRTKQKHTPKDVVCYLYGPPGIGKTTTAYTMLRDNGYEVVEINGSDARTRRRISDTCWSVFTASAQLTSGRKPALVLEEVDGLYHSDEQFSGMNAFHDMLSQALDRGYHLAPVFCVSNRHVGFFAERYTCIPMYALNRDESIAVIQRVCTLARRPMLPPDCARRLADQCAGDARQLVMKTDEFIRFDGNLANNTTDTGQTYPARARRILTGIRPTQTHYQPLSFFETQAVVHTHYPLAPTLASCYSWADEIALTDCMDHEHAQVVLTLHAVKNKIHVNKPTWPRKFYEMLRYPRPKSRDMSCDVIKKIKQ